MPLPQVDDARGAEAGVVGRTVAVTSVIAVASGDGPLYAGGMSTASSPHELELVVAEDGSIAAEQIASLGVRPGTHLRVIIEQADQVHGSIAGRLTSWPNVTWEDFERASELAQADLRRS
jgi:hypothetical protein